MFKDYLQIHHTAEDDMLWPSMRAALAGDSAEAALLDAMEAEHAAIDPLLTSIDAALADPESGTQCAGRAALSSLAIALRGHLDHEESEGLALIDATISAEQWQAFAMETGKRVGEDVQRFFPWVLDGAPPQTTAAIMTLLPPQMLPVYRDAWQPAYAALTLWPPAAGASRSA